jgi:hypothetical protein
MGALCSRGAAATAVGMITHTTCQQGEGVTSSSIVNIMALREHPYQHLQHSTSRSREDKR